MSSLNPNSNSNVIQTAHPRVNSKTLVSLAMLTAVAYVVMLLSKMLPSVNGFLDFDFKDVVICIGGFVFGPLQAAIISIVVAVIEMLTISTTGPIGCIMNILATASFCCTAAFIYKKIHTKTGAVIGLSSGVIALTVVMILWNYLITPIYQGIPRETIIPMLPTVFLPFNLVKGGLNTAVTLLLYKPIVTALRKAKLLPESKTQNSAESPFAAAFATNPEISAKTGKFNAGFLLFSLALLATFVVLALVLMKII